MKVRQLADRFGSNRQNAERPGELLRGCSCVAIPFAGGMCEVPHIKANIVLVNDLDRHVINLAEVVKFQGDKLIYDLDRTPFHPDTLREAQAFCRLGESTRNYDWAYHYFICSWMTRGGKMGTKGEFDQGLSIRWKSGGGDSVVRFRNATESLSAWSATMQRCTFTAMDCFEFLAECKERDIPENGLFIDAPWPGDGENYTHKFNTAQQVVLADRLGHFEESKIVVRFGDHPLIRGLYRENLGWTWHPVTSRTQANSAKAEFLITRNIA